MALDILLPFWGDPAMLFAAVKSILRQDSDDWKLTVVDDCYPDETVPAYFAQLDDPRITYERNEVNLGITDNYRHCIDLTTQDRVVIMGCDDLMHPNYVSTILAAHAAFPDVDLIQPGVRVIDEHGHFVTPLTDAVKQHISRPRTRTRRVLGGEELAVSLLRGDWLYWPSLAFRRETLLRTDFRDGLPVTQDLAFILDMVFAGATLLLEPTVCFSYRRHQASASSVKLLDGSRFSAEREYFEIAARESGRLGWRRAARAARGHIMSRAHALTLLPVAVKDRRSDAVKVLVGHALRPMR